MLYLKFGFKCVEGGGGCKLDSVDCKQSSNDEQPKKWKKAEMCSFKKTVRESLCD